MSCSVNVKTDSVSLEQVLLKNCKSIILKKYLFFLIFLLITIFSFSQNTAIDSLQQLLKEEKNIDKKIGIYIQLFNKIKNKDSAFVNLKFAEKLSYSKTSDSVKTLIYIAKLKYYLNQNKYDSVFYFADKALIHRKTIESLKLINLYSDVGLANYYKSEYKKALESHFKALKICDSVNNEERKPRVFNNIGITYIKLKDWDKAEIYMNKSLILCKQFNIKRGIVYTLGNLGIIYKNQDKYEKAILIYLESNKVSESLNDKVSIIRNYINIGSLYVSKNEYNNALNVYNKALIMAKKKDEKQLEANLLHNIADVYASQGKFSLAKDYYNKSLQTSKEKGYIGLVIGTHLALADLYESQGNFKQAILERKTHEKLKDSILSKEHLSDISELEIKYETEKKDKELVAKQLSIENQKNQLQKKSTQNNYMLGTVIFLALTAILLVFLFKQRHKRKNQEILTLKREVQIKTLESLIEGEEKERFRIAKELHDGVNGGLSAIKYKLSSLLEMNNKVIKEAIIMIDDSCKQVRAISHNLVPPSLEKFNLVEATEVYCGNLNDINPDVEFTFQHLGDALDISKKAEVNIFRIIQELITNSIKHADASVINVQISCHNNTIQVSIEDDGKGFDKDAVKSEGIGLSNVQSRMDYLKASVDFISNEKGTSYTIDIDKEKLNDN